MQSYRVAHAVSSLEVGGAERLVLALANAQKRLGLSVMIVTLGKDSDAFVPEARSADIPVVSLRNLRTRSSRLRATFRSLRPGTLEALHVHTPWFLRLLAPVVPFVSGSIIYTRHGAQAYDSRYWRMIHSWFHRFADHLTFVSSEALEVHRRVHRASKVPHHLLEFGVERADRPPRRRSPSDPIRLGCVGRLVELKGHRYILDAIAALEPALSESIEVHIFGDGPAREFLEDYASRKVPDRVIFHGSVVDREELYRDIDVLVVGSRTEGLSMAIMEAMARGIPAVATEVGGTPRLVIPETTGLLVPYADPEALAGAIRRIVAEPGLVVELGAAARRHVQRHFSFEQAAQKVMQLYALDEEGPGRDRKNA